MSDSKRRDLSMLYPQLNSPDFAFDICRRKEFYDTKAPDTSNVKSLEKTANLLCDSEFEIAPHQAFVRNFLSEETPYSGLLLFHGLGTGKTCTALTVAEENRAFNKKTGRKKRTLIVASPNVQQNIRLQLFDPDKLRLKDGLWNLSACTGNTYLDEINPMNLRGLSKEKVISQVEKLISSSYAFFGYIEFANYIARKIGLDDPDDPKQAKIMKGRVQRLFAGRLLIIDEIHNIRLSDDNKHKRTAQLVARLVSIVPNMKLLLLSATPMYNSPSEIIWIINLLNSNDRRETIRVEDVFAKSGEFLIDESGKEIGRELLERKATGYVSFVQGENPFTFPFRLWPNQFAPDKVLKGVPRYGLAGGVLFAKESILSLYSIDLSNYQRDVYDRITEAVIGEVEQSADKSLGYTKLQRPLEALSVVFPIEEAELDKTDLNNLVGKEGLGRIMKYKSSKWPPNRSDFEYRNPAGPLMFSPELMPKYSAKIGSVNERILNSVGVVLVYCQYIDGGVIPLALALESQGFARADQPSLFATPVSEPLDITTMKKTAKPVKQAKYVLITGDRSISSDNAKALRLVTRANNRYGEGVKVVIISQAGSEGLDFKFIRQVHVLDPWYNMNRIEQIIGRAVRRCSHKALPLAERNVEIYLYATASGEDSRETADQYIYRLAEKKAITTGKVTRMLKEISIDCLLTDKSNVISSLPPVDLKSASGTFVRYDFKDKAFKAQCDYMETCQYTCKPIPSIKPTDVIMDTYSQAFITKNTERIIRRIKDLFRETFAINKRDLKVVISPNEIFSDLEINAALSRLISNQNEHLTDRYGRLGRLENVQDIYMFVPDELEGSQSTARENRVPIPFRRRHISFETEAEPALKIVEKVAKEETTEAAKVDNHQLEDLQRFVAGVLYDEGKPDDAWGKTLKKLLPELRGSGWSDDILRMCLIHHYIDVMQYESLTNMLKEIYSDNIVIPNISDDAKRYLELASFRLNDSTLFMGESQGELKLLSVHDGVVANADPIDYEESKPIIASHKELIKSKLGQTLGYLSQFKGGKKVFKIIDYGVKRNKGARCDQSTKQLILQRIANLGYLNRDEIAKSTTRIDQCVLLELCMRRKDMEGSEIVFLRPSDALLIIG